MNNLALQKSLADVVGEYWEKYENIPQEIETLQAAINNYKMATTIGGSYGGDAIGGSVYLSVKNAQKVLLKSAWRNLYEGLNIEKIASAKDRKHLENIILETPPSFTIPNIREVFGEYILDPRYHVLKGLAEVFVDLDPAYRSHSKVKIGVEGLPKRIIISSVGCYSGSYGYEKLRDVLNSILVCDGKPKMEHGEFYDLVQGAKKNGSIEFFGGKLKSYKNGNVHVIFNSETLRIINLALAEFYGDVLPDTPQEATKKKESTEVAKDLQFYATPRSVIERIISHIHFSDGVDVLEPSCGEGAIMDVIREKYGDKIGRMLGIEVDFERAQVARSKGHDVTNANFLDIPPKPMFDVIVMNPPFYGEHYKKHINHAKGFLKDRGVLVSVLPATAHYDHKNTFGKWINLPVGSFRESGTNINTGYMIWRK